LIYFSSSFYTSLYLNTWFLFNSSLVPSTPEAFDHHFAAKAFIVLDLHFYPIQPLSFCSFYLSFRFFPSSNANETRIILSMIILFDHRIFSFSH